MRELDPKEQTFAKGTFGRFVKRHGITRGIAPIDPVQGVESPHVKRSNIFVVSLEKGGRSSRRIMEFDRIFEFLPEVEDALEYVANELAFLRRFEGDTPGLAEFLGVDPGDLRLQDTLAGLRTDAATFRALVGEDAYQEFLTITEARGPIPEEPKEASEYLPEEKCGLCGVPFEWDTRGWEVRVYRGVKRHVICHEAELEWYREPRGFFPDFSALLRERRNRGRGTV